MLRGHRNGGGFVGRNVAASSPLINVGVYPTTGGHFDLQVNRTDTIEHLKKMISKKLKVAKERICLLYKEKDLREGSLHENNVQEGSRIILLPMVETGLLTQRPEQSVLQALESLSDAQVNDFLSGKAPLNLTMRLGDHMMFIQLQLSTVGTTLTRTKGLPGHHHHHHHHHQATPPGGSTATPKTSATGEGCSSATAADASASPATMASRSAPTLPTGCPSPKTPPASPRISAGAPKSTTTTVSTCGHLPGSASTATVRPCLAASPASGSVSRGHRQRCLTDVTHLLDTRTLAEESPQHVSSRRQGAIIESMHHHGRGVYSGTFSGTLNPALQDRHGHPKRDISTIVHILNDLLGATPQYRRHHGGRAPAETPGVVHLHNPSATASGRGNGQTFETTTKEYSRLSLENQATRGKMEQLQLMLEERRARRRARRETHAPYPVSWSTASGSLVVPHADPCGGAATMLSSVPTPAEELGGDVKPEVSRPSSVKSDDGGDGTPTPMECDAAEEGLENSSNNSSGATNEYLKLNPETVVA